MSFLGPPIFDFDELKPVTMTIIASLNVEKLNLAAIFALLPVTDQTLPPGIKFQRKLEKIKLPPELNSPGEIISMRWNGNVRGIVRSEKTKSFPHSIIIDVGTSKRIVSLKLSPKIELTGATSAELAEEASMIIINLVKKCQENLDRIRNFSEIANQIQEIILSEKFNHTENIKDTGNAENTNSQLTKEIFNDLIRNEEEKEDENRSQIMNQIFDFYNYHTKNKTFQQKEEFFNFLASFKENLYSGELFLGEFQYEMVNLHFHLGYSINQVKLTEIMNSYPFVAKFKNIKSSSSVTVLFYYTKYERNTGKPIQAKHTITVNKSGHVRHSGPNLTAMKPVYYAFMQRTLANYKQIQSLEKQKQRIKITGPGKILSREEWIESMKKDEKFREKVMNSDYTEEIDKLRSPASVNSESPQKSNLMFKIVNETENPKDLEPTSLIIEPEINTEDCNNEEVFNFDYLPLKAY